MTIKTPAEIANEIVNSISKDGRIKFAGLDRVPTDGELTRAIVHAAIAASAPSPGLPRNTDPAYWRNTGIINALWERSPLVAEDEIPELLASIAGDHLAMPDHEVIATYLGDNRAYTMIDLIADALNQRGSDVAAELVIDTDPDDDLWKNYIGPMIDSIEADYTKMAEEQ